MNMAFFRRLLILPLLALLFIVIQPGQASAEEGRLLTNTETGDSVWIPDSHILGVNMGVNGSGYEAARNSIGCDGLFDVNNGSWLQGDRPCTSEAMRHDEAPEGSQFYNPNTGDIEGSHESDRTWALMLFSYATGGSCITCDFMAYFMNGLTEFSLAVYEFFHSMFMGIVPFTIAIWIGYRAAKILAFGGEDGRAFIYSIVQKLALFSIIFLALSVSVGDDNSADAPTEHFAWNTVGPHYLGYIFDISSALRNESLRVPGVADDVLEGAADADGNRSPYDCGVVNPATGTAAMSARYPYIAKGVEISCVTERTHLIGISTGLAVIFSSWSPAGLSLIDIAGFAKALLLGVVKIIMGIFMMAVYLLSAVWLIFLTLDIVTRVMMTAAFLPVLATMYLYVPTRGMAGNAAKAFFTTAMTAVALSIVSVLAIFLMANTITVYEALYPNLGSGHYSGYRMEDISAATKILEIREFITRVQESDTQQPRIPMDFGSPWFYYMALSGIAIFAVGKKIISMLEQIMGFQGISAFADAATKHFKTAAYAGAAGGALGLMAGKRLAGYGGVGISAAYGASHGALAGPNGMGAGAGYLGRRIAERYANPHPFSNTERGAKKSILSRASEISTAGRAASAPIDQIDEN